MVLKRSSSASLFTRPTTISLGIQIVSNSARGALIALASPSPKYVESQFGVAITKSISLSSMFSSERRNEFGAISGSRCECWLTQPR
jgi:hypothetical protein